MDAPYGPHGLHKANNSPEESPVDVPCVCLSVTVICAQETIYAVRRARVDAPTPLVRFVVRLVVQQIVQRVVQ